MTEQEAMQNTYGTSGWRNSESVFNSGWKAALEWAKSQQEPVLYMYDFEMESKKVKNWTAYSLKEAIDCGGFNIRPLFFYPNHHEQTGDYYSEVSGISEKTYKKSDVLVLVDVLMDIGANGFSNFDRDKARQALAKWEGRK